MDSEGEGFYNNSGDVIADSASEHEEDNVVDYAGAVSPNRKPYKILTEDDIRRLLDNDISTVSDFLSVSRDQACTLLCRNNWSVFSVYDKWAATADDTDSHPASAGSELQQVCNICYDELTSQNTLSAACGHPFCAHCWKTYVATSISGGPGCLTLSCPEPGCGAAVGIELVESLASEAGKLKYYSFLRRSYVELSRRRKWCPAPGCGLAVEFDDDDGESGYDVTCGCSHKFCWNCTADHHRPVGCETVRIWTEKNNLEELNIKWIELNTKPCPKCRRPIEKNQGCHIMTCRSPCYNVFCWLCLQPLGSHSSRVCNTYSVERERGGNETIHLERYTHYYERWHSNERSRKVAMADMQRWRDEYLAKLGEVQGELDSQLQFVMEAWEQIVECRRVLKWSFTYGYYLKGESSEKTELFEHWQELAVLNLERLHDCVENEMKEYLRCHNKDFKDFRGTLIGLTAVTKNFFENLVKAMENINIAQVVSGTSCKRDEKQPIKRSANYAARDSGKYRRLWR